MFSIKFSAVLVLVNLYFVRNTYSLPSSDYGNLEDNGVLPLGGMKKYHSDEMEFAGVYDGRKRRYIIQRASSDQCCKKKPTCLMGEILEKCKCKKCSLPQVPGLDGKSCQADCPQGQKKNKGGGCCPTGMESDKSGTKCECPAGQKEKPGGGGCDDGSDKDKARKGNCPDGKVLDPKEGQTADAKNPKCQIDDEKDCKKPNIPATRPEGKELDTSYKVGCGKPQDDNKRPRCNSKTHYTKVSVDADGKATEECQKTKQFQQRKKSKVQDLKGKFKDKWTKSKSQREEQGKQRQEKLKSLKDKRKQLQTDADNRQKELDKNDKKKARMGKCSTVTALMMGLAQNLAQKRDEVHPYDWTTDYFDEDFMASDDRLKEFPSDIDIDKISCTDDKCGDINAEAWMKAWQEQAQAADLKNNWPTCTQMSKRKLHPRCPAKRSKTAIRMPVSENLSSLDNLPTTKALVSCHGDPNACTSSLEQRQVPFVNIIIEVALFATRLGVSLLSRTASSIARWAPRLANIAKNTDRLFKIAPKGKAGARSVDAMKDAFGKIAKNPNFKKCIKDGLP